MSFNVTVEPSGHTFTTERGESILEAADRQGVSLPYGCRNGACGSCASILVSGTVIYLDGDEELVCDKPEDYCLTCQAIPSSDITIRAHEVEDEEDEEIRTLVCSVEQMDKLSHDVMRVYLRLPENERLKYLAGQYLDFILEDGRRRAFSIANAPHDDELIELHIRHVTNRRSLPPWVASSCGKIQNDPWCSWLAALALRRSRPLSSTASILQTDDPFISTGVSAANRISIWVHWQRHGPAPIPISRSHRYSLSRMQTGRVNVALYMRQCCGITLT